ncbi:mechanosensitive ion channel family protein [Acetobacter estunensis]|uniref:mechanosensitive ion channel family protein n=1 Tax=Acetobacter estunensis TaxID=104097 RepID=UPI001C2D548E|nr:mechanosensitive ion channel family protein [Acetobacter estunensis]MBV1838235.1 mechanosensitive ion channel family protein [Acetobacter estunensis]
MKETFFSALANLLQWFVWLPPTFASLLILAMVGVLAAGVTGLVITRGLARVPGKRRGSFIRSSATTLRHPAQVMAAAVMTIIAIPALELPMWLAGGLAHAFAVMLVLAMGVGLVKAARLASSIYIEHIDASADDREEDILGRKHFTQVRLLQRMAEIIIGVLTIGTALMTFDPVRQYGLSLLASAGAASIIVGFAARSVITNLIAGAQIAITQPIRMGDMIAFNGDWTWVEEINATFVVLKAWDKRRRIVPLSYFLDNPFENWTYNSAELTGAVYLPLDFLAPMPAIRAKLGEIVESCPEWNGKDFSVQVADANDRTMMVRVTAGARTAIRSWDLRCAIREQIIDWIRDNCPEAFPQTRFSAHASAPDNPHHLMALGGPETAA